MPPLSAYRVFVSYVVPSSVTLLAVFDTSPPYFCASPTSAFISPRLTALAVLTILIVSFSSTGTPGNETIELAILRGSLLSIALIIPAPVFTWFNSLMVLGSKPGSLTDAPAALRIKPNVSPLSIALIALYAWINGAAGGYAIDSTDKAKLANPPLSRF